MTSPVADRAITDAAVHGKAILKFITPNDLGLTGSHQKGYYLPKPAWEMYTPQAPLKSVNYDHHVSVVWQDGTVTQSVVKWYGNKTRAEYRLTRFGRGFPYLDGDCVGSLLVLVIKSLTEFFGYVFDLEEDIEGVQAGLGVEVVGSWATYDRDRGDIAETPDECLDRHFRDFTSTLGAFPTTSAFSEETERALEACVEDFLKSPGDERLLTCVESEYRLFKMVERKLCEPEIVRVFASVDDFIETAQRILQRRKARAGWSLENHVETILKQAEIPYQLRQNVEGTRPDVLIPSKAEYLNPMYPLEKLFAIGVKTTCKDRWRQVLREAPRVQAKHILTVQQGISASQLREMNDSGVSLIVPRRLHSHYPKEYRATLLTVEQFIEHVLSKLSS